ncbi:ribose-phosphate diphosphokinase [Candidatus Woesearchaeota archaeon]|nr:ribose-phosphate diphosphokinase [Candidatus Woesearchaeota archaeon]
MIIIGCSRGKHIAGKIAKKLNKPYSELNAKRFPDGEIYVRFMKNVKGKDVVLVQSFYGYINDCVVEAIFAAETARELGAKSVTLVAPYFAYLRQDSRFNPGECISIKVIGKLFSRYFDKIIVIDPHLHRQTKLKDLFSTKIDKLTTNPYIADYIKKNIKNPLIVGPDWESYKWAQRVAEKIGYPFVILNKKRLSGRKVKITINKKIDIGNKNIVFVDDIISTGHTILEAAKKLKRLGAEKFCCIAVHGLFVEHALEKLRKAKINVITTNTIPNKVSKIDVSGLVAEKLSNKRV